MLSTPIQTFHLRGADTLDNVINTVTVNYYGDGTWTFTDAASGKTIEYDGSTAEINLLLQNLVVGTNGLPVGTKLFGFA